MKRFTFGQTRDSSHIRSGARCAGEGGGALIGDAPWQAAARIVGPGAFDRGRTPQTEAGLHPPPPPEGSPKNHNTARQKRTLASTRRRHAREREPSKCTARSVSVRLRNHDSPSSHLRRLCRDDNRSRWAWHLRIGRRNHCGVTVVRVVATRSCATTRARWRSRRRSSTRSTTRAARPRSSSRCARGRGPATRPRRAS